MNIKVLGSGCKNCINLENNVKQAVEEMGIEIEVIKISDFKEILKYEVTAMPALIINEKIVSCGKVLSSETIKLLITENL